MQTTPTARRAATAALTTTVVSVCPVFLVGGLSVQITGELKFTPAGLGLITALYFTSSALVSITSGRLVERFGTSVTGRTAIGIAAIALIGMASAQTFATLAVWMTLAGPANSLGQLSSNALLARRVPLRRQGIMFGVKQASVPFSTTIAGLSVPVVALTIGWRWAFVLAAALALYALPIVPKVARPQPPRTDQIEKTKKKPSLGLIVITIAATLGATAANPLGTFIADYTVYRGFSEAAAGLIVTLGGVAGLIARISVGWIADRRTGGRLTMIAIMLSTGSIGLALLAFGIPWMIPLGTALGFALGWAWPGLLNFAVSRLHPDAPAAATGVTQTGVYLGGGLGPLGFGLLIDQAGYPTAWATVTVLMMLGAIGMVVGRRLVLRATP